MSKIEVTLAKALKRKNELVQLINEKKSIITRYNSYDNRNTPPFMVGVEHSNLCDLVAQLAETKAAIAIANTAIQPQLHLQAELRSLCSFYDTIPTDVGLYDEHNYGSNTIVERTKVATLDPSDIVANKAKLQTQISELQDQIDAFNATTKVMIPVSNKL
jgi:hypothetical protein